MGDTFVVFLIFLALTAALFRADFVLMLIYLLGGVFIIGRWWSRKAIKAVSTTRSYDCRAFLGQKVPVRLSVNNLGWLPLVWLQLRESLPPELSLRGGFQQVLYLGSKSSVQYEYVLEGRRRGYYQLGPLALRSGDLLGISSEIQETHAPDFLTVFPKIIPLTRVTLPSQSPLGTIRHARPIFEDPSRVWGKRDYITGDSMRRVDWKASAASGRLQVKLFEPSIALETVIFLNLNTEEYEPRTRPDMVELGIVVTASLANWVIGRRQAAGLVTNGFDPQQPGTILAIHPRRGRGHLMRMLDILARLEAAVTMPAAELLRQESARLSWGTTVILLTQRFDDALFDSLFYSQSRGMNVVLVACGPITNLLDVQHRAAYFGFPFIQLMNERDLDIWRQ